MLRAKVKSVLFVDFIEFFRAWKDPIDELDRLTSQWAESLWADDEQLVDNVNYIKKRLARDYNKKVKKGFAKTEALEL